VAIDPRIAALVPHQGSMCLLERIESWDDAGIRLTTMTHVDPANPLATRLGLRALHLCEYGAQAMAVHGGLMTQARHQAVRPGLLVSLRDVTLHCDFIHQLPGPLVVAALRLHESAAGWQYSFQASHADVLLATGRATVATLVRP
jgi:predicted hotdog family 3-hydroxylacyl-ACP dehydratase